VLCADCTAGKLCPVSSSVHFVQEGAALLMRPDISFQTAVMLLREGANGKSTLLRLLESWLGGENVASVALHRLEEVRFAVAELEGTLANIFAALECEHCRRLRSSRLLPAGGSSALAPRSEPDRVPRRL